MDMLAGSQDLQAAMRLGSGKDIYYYTRDTLHKQSIPTIVDNKFIQALNQTGAGSSTFIFSADQGLSDILFAAQLPEEVGGIDYTNLAVPRGYLYQLINRVSVRYAGSSQQFFTGEQTLLSNLREMPNPTTKDNMYALGGTAMNDSVSAPFAGDNLFAYAYLNLPHNSPNGGLMKPNPFPTELLNSPVVITLELNPIESIFSSGRALGSIAGAPSQLKKAYFQVKQVHAKDRSELMASDSDRSKAYSFPTKGFYQNEIQIALSGQLDYEPLLTGFRNGEVRSIIMWVTKNSDTNPALGAPFAKNFNKYILPRNIEVRYNGTVYYRADDTASQFWNLVSTKTPSQLACTVLTAGAPGADLTITPQTANWVEVPFSQVFEQLSGSHMYVAGLAIQNAVVNLKLSLPDTSAHTLHVFYTYNSVMMLQGGNCEFVF